MTDRPHSNEQLADNTKEIEVDGEEKLLMFDDDETEEPGQEYVSEDELKEFIRNHVAQMLVDIL